MTDFTDVAYPSLDATFAPPPGTDTGERTATQRQWTTRRARFHHPGIVPEVVEDLAQRGASAVSVDGGEPIDGLWPKPGVDGEYFVPQVDPAFVVRGRDGRAVVRTLDLALPDRTAGDGGADAFDRLELVRLIALVISRLHERDLVTAGITWESFAFTLEPRPSVVLHQPERVRRIGGEFLEPPSRSGPTGSSNSPFDSDRGDFAVLAFRLLVALGADADLRPHSVEGIPGTTQEQSATLTRLWERAAGPAGSRPQLVEWLDAFGLGDHG